MIPNLRFPEFKDEWDTKLLMDSIGKANRLSQINDSMLAGLDKLISQDGYLLAYDVNERAITHKLGEYYQDIFANWNVDCEYNKNLGDPKLADIDPERFISMMAKVLVKNESLKSEQVDTIVNGEIKRESAYKHLLTQLREANKGSFIYDEELDLLSFVLKLTNGKKITKSIYPDIIIHHRGTRYNNIVIEVKKTTHSNKLSSLYDMVKLLTLVQSPQYNYSAGYFIELPASVDLRDHKNFEFNESQLDYRVRKVVSQ